MKAKKTLLILFSCVAFSALFTFPGALSKYGLQIAITGSVMNGIFFTFIPVYFAIRVFQRARTYFKNRSNLKTSSQEFT